MTTRSPVVACLVSVALIGCGSDDGSAARDAGGSDGGGGLRDSGGATDGSAIPDAAADAGARTSIAPGNALLLADGTVTPLYPVTGHTRTRAVAFRHDGEVLRALDEHGEEIWARDVGAGGLFGGFDFDADGFPDVGIARSEDTGAPCGKSTILSTWIDFAQGADGTMHSPVAPLDSICWTFATTTYPTHQWSSLGVMFGAGSPVLALTPYYATTGWFFVFEDGTFRTLAAFHYPSSSAYDDAYVADRPNAHGTGTSYSMYAHVANGLSVERGGETRLAFFTSARFVEYRVGPLDAAQLVLDLPYLTAGRTDIVGRNYGLVQVDPGDPDRVVLVAGTSVQTVHADLVAGAMVTDPWAGIERHVSIVDLASGSVDDRFFSYAHDAGDGHQYEGRVAYPANAIVRAAGGSSRLAFNVYEGGHWMLHVTEPGRTADAAVMRDLLLWDIADLDRDGVDEWVLSPVRDPEDPDVSGYYFPKRRLRIARWDESARELVTLAEHDGLVPHLVSAFREPTRTTSAGYLYPALVTRVGTDELRLVARDAGGVPVTLPLEW